jgi:hypothetical protein
MGHPSDFKSVVQRELYACVTASPTATTSNLRAAVIDVGLNIEVNESDGTYAPGVVVEGSVILVGDRSRIP